VTDPFGRAIHIVEVGKPEEVSGFMADDTDSGQVRVIEFGFGVIILSFLRVLIDRL
jgi:hypothetical protein